MDFGPLCQVAAGRHRVSADVHPEDHIFRFLIENRSFASQTDAVDYYFDDGARSFGKLLDVLTKTCRLAANEPIRILEFASGYGCVTRHAKNAATRHAITACDIHPEAVRFVQEKLQNPAVLSHRLPESLELAANYDVVFALSFFSHMPKTSFGRWLKRLAALVDTGRCGAGWLIFTTHGLLSRKFLGECPLDDDGFWFRGQSEQGDLDVQDYGLTLTRPDYVLKQLFEIPNVMLASYREGFWWEHQDLWVLKITA